jgi:hypothetical protein
LVFVANNKKINELIGWTALITPKLGIADSILWTKSIVKL